MGFLKRIFNLLKFQETNCKHRKEQQKANKIRGILFHSVSELKMGQQLTKLVKYIHISVSASPRQNGWHHHSSIVSSWAAGFQPLVNVWIRLLLQQRGSEPNKTKRSRLRLPKTNFVQIDVKILDLTKRSKACVFESWAMILKLPERIKLLCTSLLQGPDLYWSSHLKDLELYLGNLLL